MSEDRLSTDVAIPEGSGTLRDQESILVLLNLGLLTAIAVVHVLFGPALLGGKEETHYVVLMVIPVIAAAWPRSWRCW